MPKYRFPLWWSTLRIAVSVPQEFPDGTDAVQGRTVEDHRGVGARSFPSVRPLNFVESREEIEPVGNVVENDGCGLSPPGQEVGHCQAAADGIPVAVDVGGHDEGAGAFEKGDRGVEVGKAHRKASAQGSSRRTKWTRSERSEPCCMEKPSKAPNSSNRLAATMAAIWSSS